MNNQLFQLSIATRAGQFVARYSAKGLAELKFPSVGRASSRAVGRRRRGNESPILSGSGEPVRDSSRRLLRIPAQILRWHRATAAGLKSSLAGRAPKNLPPLDLVRERNFSGKSGTRCGKFPPAGRKATVKSRRRLANRTPFAPWAAHAARIRSRFLCRAIACSPRTKNWVVSPADWIGNAACSRVKA